MGPLPSDLDERDSRPAGSGYLPTRAQWERAMVDQRVWRIARALIKGLLDYRDQAGAAGFQLEKLDDRLAGLRRLLDGRAPPVDPCAECGQLQLLTVEEWLKRRRAGDPAADQPVSAAGHDL